MAAVTARNHVADILLMLYQGINSVVLRTPPRHQPQKQDERAHSKVLCVIKLQVGLYSQGKQKCITEVPISKLGMVKHLHVFLNRVSATIYKQMQGTAFCPPCLA